MLNTVLLLLFFRCLADIPALNVDETHLQHLLAANPFLGFVDLLAGGEVLTHFSVVAAGIFPYLVAALLAQGAVLVVPSLRDLRSESEKLKKRVTFITKVLTVPLAFAFAFALSHFLARQTGLFPGGVHWFTRATVSSSLWVVCLVTLGSVLSAGIVNWITRKGIGSGENIVLLAGASLALGKQVGAFLREAPDITDAVERLGIGVAAVITFVALAFWVMSMQRRVPVALPRVRPGAVARATQTIPLNGVGIVPVSSAIGLLTLSRFAVPHVELHLGGVLGRMSSAVDAWLTPAGGGFWVALGLLIVLFTYICNLAVIEPGPGKDDVSLAERMRRRGEFIPGVRPGAGTDGFLSHTVAWMSLFGGLCMALLVAGLPCLILRLTHRDVILTALSLLIVAKTVVGLRDVYRADGTMEKYEGFMKRAQGKV